jgi:ubiquinone/menaquinone biosynthesis C-methylase UbiE
MADFSNIASYYDLMTGFKDRLINEFGIIKFLVEKFDISTALDAGCGTGVHSIILSKIGVDVIGLDSSADMLEIARTNALKAGVEPEFVKEYFESMPCGWADKFDAVFCLANSLVGVENGERLSLAFKSFHRVLKPGGRAIIQVLNFLRFRRGNRRIIKVSTNENLTFVRFLDFEEKETRLNVLVIEHEMGDVDHKFNSQKILGINREIIRLASNSARFSSAKFYSDLSLSEKASNDSTDLIAVVTK